MTSCAFANCLPQPIVREERGNLSALLALLSTISQATPTPIPMKRIGYTLLSCVVLLALYTISLAQLEAKAAKYLFKVISGEHVRGYFGSAVDGACTWTGGPKLFAVSETGEMNGPTRKGQVMFYDGLQAEKPVLTISSSVEGELFGKALSGGGDWNGDGLPDFAVGAPGGLVGKDKDLAGRVYVYFGGTDFGNSAAASLTSGEDQRRLWRGRFVERRHKRRWIGRSRRRCAPFRQIGRHFGSRLCLVWQKGLHTFSVAGC